MESEKQDAGRPLQTELGRTYAGAAGARQPARDIAAEFGERATAQGEAAVEWMKAHPVTSAAIGLGIGVLIGMAIGRGVR